MACSIQASKSQSESHLASSFSSSICHMCKSHTVAKNFDSYLRLAQKIRDMTCAEMPQRCRWLLLLPLLLPGSAIPTWRASQRRGLESDRAIEGELRAQHETWPVTHSAGYCCMPADTAADGHKGAAKHPNSFLLQIRRSDWRAGIRCLFSLLCSS